MYLPFMSAHGSFRRWGGGGGGKSQKKRIKTKNGSPHAEKKPYRSPHYDKRSKKPPTWKKKYQNGLQTVKKPLIKKKRLTTWRKT